MRTPICTRLDAPIVLAHGLFGFGQIGLGRLTLACYFHGIPGFLRAGGNRVLVTRVPPIAGVKRRARVLAQQIERAFPGEPVHLFGHSMGGLDARQLLADPDWSERVLSLTTIGTPHLGSALADAARVRVGRVYRLLRRMGVEYHGFLDVTRRAARAVNRNGRASAPAHCFSVAGDPRPADVLWFLQPFYEVLRDLEGPNDGLVSVESALAFGTPLPVWPVDHFRQMNWLPPARGVSSSCRVLGLYAGLVDNLAGLGFAGEGPVLPGPMPRVASGRVSEIRRRGVSLPPWLLRLRARSPVQEHGDRHVAEDV
jgi:triacylglycerol lipase